MNRFQITHVSIMFEKGWDFEYTTCDLLAYSRPSDKKHGKEYVYYITDKCNICKEPYIKKRGSISKAHSKCKMIPYKKEIALIKLKKIKDEKSKKIAEYEKAIEETYKKIAEIYAKCDIEIEKAHEHNKAAIKKSYASKAGAWVLKRNRLKKELEDLNV